MRPSRQPLAPLAEVGRQSRDWDVDYEDYAGEAHGQTQSSLLDWDVGVTHIGQASQVDPRLLQGKSIATSAALDWDVDTEGSSARDWDIGVEDSNNHMHDKAKKRGKHPGRNHGALVDWDHEVMLDWDHEVTLDWDGLPREAPGRMRNARAPAKKETRRKGIPSESPGRGESQEEYPIRDSKEKSRQWVVDHVLLQAANDMLPEQRRRRKQAERAAWTLLDWDKKVHRKSNTIDEEGGEQRSLTMRIEIIEGMALFKDGELEGCESYVVVDFGDDGPRAHATRPSERTQNPKWHDDKTLVIPRNVKQLSFSVWDQDLLSSDEHLGSLYVRLDNFVEADQTMDEWYDVGGGAASNGSLRLRMTLSDIEIFDGGQLSEDGSRTPERPYCVCGEQHLLEEVLSLEDYISLYAEQPLRNPGRSCHVRVCIVEARYLWRKNGDAGDAFVVVAVRGGSKPYTTRVVENSEHPQWNESVSLHVPPGPEAMLELSVWDLEQLIHQPQQDQDPANEDFQLALDNEISGEKFRLGGGRNEERQGGQKKENQADIPEPFEEPWQLTEEERRRKEYEDEIKILTRRRRPKQIGAIKLLTENTANAKFTSGAFSRLFTKTKKRKPEISEAKQPSVLISDAELVLAAPNNEEEQDVKVDSERFRPQQGDRKDEGQDEKNTNFNSGMFSRFFKKGKKSTSQISETKQSSVLDSDDKLVLAAQDNEEERDVKVDSESQDVSVEKEQHPKTHGEQEKEQHPKTQGEYDIEAKSTSHGDDAAQKEASKIHEEQELQMEVEKDASQHDFLGSAAIDLDSLRIGATREVWVEIGSGTAEHGAQICVSMLVSEDTGSEGSITDDSVATGSSRHSLHVAYMNAVVVEARGMEQKAVAGQTVAPEREVFVVLDPGSGEKPFTTTAKVCYGSAEWREEVVLEIPIGLNTLAVTIWDKEAMLEDLYLGTCCIDLDSLPMGQQVDRWYSLGGGIAKEELEIRLQLTVTSSLNDGDWDDISDTGDLVVQRDRHIKQQLGDLLKDVRSGDPNARGLLQVDVIEAFDLPADSHAFVFLSLGAGREPQWTKRAAPSPCPSWRETLMFEVPAAMEVLEISVWDQDPFDIEKNILMGVADFPVRTLRLGKSVNRWFDLHEGTANTGKVRLCLSLHHHEVEELVGVVDDEG